VNTLVYICCVALVPPASPLLVQWVSIAGWRLGGKGGGGAVQAVLVLVKQRIAFVVVCWLLDVKELLIY
jgi:hypothetical protein